MPAHLRTADSSFHTTMAQSSRCSRDHLAWKSPRYLGYLGCSLLSHGGPPCSFKLLSLEYSQSSPYLRTSKTFYLRSTPSSPDSLPTLILYLIKKERHQRRAGIYLGHLIPLPAGAGSNSKNTRESPKPTTSGAKALLHLRGRW